jgi:predicted nucleotidyltransferase component of viral defense system
MGWQKINLQKYIAEIKRNMNLDVSDEIVKKDLFLTFILAEFEKYELGDELIFKGGTLLSRNYLKYHRFSEDLDFVHKDSGQIRQLPRKQRERKIKKFIDKFVPKLKNVADALDLDFSIDRSNTKYCTIIRKRAVYTFRLYYEESNYIKIEINFVEEMLNKPKEISVKVITDFFDSKKLLFDLNLSYENFNVLSYAIEEIILEKYRALLTRPRLMERDLFDLFLIKDSLKVSIGEVVEKIINSSLIKKDLEKFIKDNLEKLKNNEFFKSEEKISDLAIIKYDEKGFEKFKEKIALILINICKLFLNKIREISK